MYLNNKTKLPALANTLKKNFLMMYCAIMIIAFVYWITNYSIGFGPLDDHRFINTIFQGKAFHAYIAPKLGRFMPLAAQEFVLLAKFFGPSAQLFYLIQALKIIICSGFLFSCLKLIRLNNFAVGILWTSVLFSMGIANTLFRIQASELNMFILMLLFTKCMLVSKFHKNALLSWRNKYLIVAFFAFLLVLFYKESAFVFGLIFALSEIIRFYWIKKSKFSIYLISILFISILYIVCYGVWSYIYTTNSYVNSHVHPLWLTLLLFAKNDPFIILIILPMTMYRTVSIFIRSSQYSIYDSFLLAASAYTCAFIILKIFSAYYLLPAYAFSICGLAGILAEYSNLILRRFILTCILLLNINTLPMALSDIQTQKLIAHNHFPFVTFLAKWLQDDNNPKPLLQNLVLVGASQGRDIEIFYSLKTFLVSLGASESSFTIKATEPSDNKAINEAVGLREIQAYKQKANDLLIFNPYQTATVHPPLHAPSYQKIYQTAQSWALPRWMAWHWIKLCLIHRHACTFNVSAAMRYAGYEAVLVSRSPAPLQLVPLESTPLYHIQQLKLPPRLRAGRTKNLNISIENSGTETWPANGTYSLNMLVHLSYVWINEKGQIALEGNRFSFPEPIQPGDHIKVSVLLKTPTQPGKYNLIISPVQEGVRWFYRDNTSDFGNNIILF